MDSDEALLSAHQPPPQIVRGVRTSAVKKTADPYHHHSESHRHPTLRHHHEQDQQHQEQTQTRQGRSEGSVSKSHDIEHIASGQSHTDEANSSTGGTTHRHPHHLQNLRSRTQSMRAPSTRSRRQTTSAARHASLAQPQIIPNPASSTLLAARATQDPGVYPSIAWLESSHTKSRPHRLQLQMHQQD